MFNSIRLTNMKPVLLDPLNLKSKENIITCL